MVLIHRFAIVTKGEVGARRHTLTLLNHPEAPTRRPIQTMIEIVNETLNLIVCFLPPILPRATSTTYINLNTASH